MRRNGKPREQTGRWVRVVALVCLGSTAAACSDLNGVREFSRSAAKVSSSYPVAASAYVDSATTSAPYLIGPAVLSASSVPRLSLATSATSAPSQRAQRQQQVDAALALEAVLGDYFATLARLAGDDAATLATAKAVAGDMKTVVGGGLDRTTLDAASNLIKTLGDFALQPARERAVKELVRDGGADAMRILGALRSVAGDWRSQVGNDAKLVDDTLGSAVLPADVPPLLRLLANDRQAELRRSYAVTLRRMGGVVAALDAVSQAHADLTEHLDELQEEPLRRRLEQAAVNLRAARESLQTLR